MTIRETRGKLGEEFALKMLGKYGFSEIEFSADKYDQDKDITAKYQGKSVGIEVKTQALFYVASAFSLPESQLAKCENVDFFFMLITKTDDLPDNNWTKAVYLVKPSFARTKNEKLKTWIVPLLQNKVKFVCKIDDDSYSEICKHYNGKY